MLINKTNYFENFTYGLPGLGDFCNFVIYVDEKGSGTWEPFHIIKISKSLKVSGTWETISRFKVFCFIFQHLKFNLIGNSFK